MERRRSMLKKNQPAWGDAPNSVLPAAREAPAQLLAQAPTPTLEPDAGSASLWCGHPLPEDPGGDSGKQRMDHLNPSQGDKPAITARGWTLEGLVSLGTRFEAVPRISGFSKTSVLAQAIRAYEDEGKPLIISNWHRHPQWPKDKFSVDWLLEYGDQRVHARNCLDWTDKEMTLVEFIERSRGSTEFVEPEDTERYYGKDATCPTEWEEWIEGGILPDQLLPNGSNNLLQYFPKSERVETLMCYLGIGDTFTPAHKDLCASSGQNLMCYTENGGSSFWFMTESSAAPAAAAYFQSLGHELDHETKVITPEELAQAPFKVYIAEQKLGDLVLVPKRSCHQVVNFGGLTIKASWSRMTIDGLITAFHHELPIYRRVCRPEVYRVKSLCQRAILHFSSEFRKLREKLHPREPELSSATSVHTTLAQAASSSDAPSPSDLQEGSLPSQLSLQPAPPVEAQRAAFLSDAEVEKMEAEQSRLFDEIRKLMDVFDKILKEEHPGQCSAFRSVQSRPETSNIEGPSTRAPPPSSHVHLCCDFCGADIFQSYFECKRCGGAEPVSPSHRGDAVPATTSAAEGLIICPGCYVEGRSCACKSMDPAQRRPFEELFEERNQVSRMLAPLVTKWYQRRPDMCVKLLNGTDHLPVFEGACLLWEAQRQDAKLVLQGKKSDRQCAAAEERGKTGSHPVARSSALSCKKCHSTKCFRHLLNYGVHASEALVEHRKDPEHEKWHDFHMKHRGLFNKKQAEGMAAETTGRPLHARVSFALAAIKYTTCQPISPKTSIGWYDRFYYESAFLLDTTLEQGTVMDAASTAASTAVSQQLIHGLNHVSEASAAGRRTSSLIGVERSISNTSSSQAPQRETAKTHDDDRRQRRRSAHAILPPTSMILTKRTDPPTKRNRAFVALPTMVSLHLLKQDYVSVEEIFKSKSLPKGKRFEVPVSSKSRQDERVEDSDSSSSLSSDSSPPRKYVKTASPRMGEHMNSDAPLAKTANLARVSSAYSRSATIQPAFTTDAPRKNPRPTTFKPANLANLSRKPGVEHDQPPRASGSATFGPTGLERAAQKSRKELDQPSKDQQTMASRPASLPNPSSNASYKHDNRPSTNSRPDLIPRLPTFRKKNQTSPVIAHANPASHTQTTTDVPMGPPLSQRSDFSTPAFEDGQAPTVQSTPTSGNHVQHAVASSSRVSPSVQSHLRLSQTKESSSSARSTATYPACSTDRPSMFSEPEPSNSQPSAADSSSLDNIRRLLIPLVKDLVREENSDIRQQKPRAGDASYEETLEKELQAANQAKRIEDLEARVADQNSRIRKLEDALHAQDAQAGIFQHLQTMALARATPPPTQAPIVLQLRGLDNAPDPLDLSQFRNHNSHFSNTNFAPRGRGRGRGFTPFNQSRQSGAWSPEGQYGPSGSRPNLSERWSFPGRPANGATQPNLQSNGKYKRRWDQGPGEQSVPQYQQSQQQQYESQHSGYRQQRVPERWPENEYDGSHQQAVIRRPQYSTPRNHYKSTASIVPSNTNVRSTERESSIRAPAIERSSSVASTAQTLMYRAEGNHIPEIQSSGSKKGSSVISVEDSQGYLDNYDERTPPPTDSEASRGSLLMVRHVPSSREPESQITRRSVTSATVEIDDNLLYAAHKATLDESYYNGNPWASEYRPKI